MSLKLLLPESNKLELFLDFGTIIMDDFGFGDISFILLILSIEPFI
jgi:hypothetical protein